MDFGDIIYFVLLVFFMILGFFNDSRKKKQKQQQPKMELPPFLEDLEDEEPVYTSTSVTKRQMVTPPPVSAPTILPNSRREFQSSSDLVSIHDSQPEQSGMAFDYDVNSFYEKDQGALNASENSSAEQMAMPVNRLIKNLKEGNRREELIKGLVYSEILRRKY